MSEEESTERWAKYQWQGGIFNDVLRRNLATWLKVKNFRKLALVHGEEMLASESDWPDADLS